MSRVRGRLRLLRRRSALPEPPPPPEPLPPQPLPLEPLLSVVLPVYQVEAYLAECLDSLLAQTYRRLEVVVVDDGSTDGGPAILERYAARDDRVRVVRQRNRGLGSARNTGLEHAGGDLVAFADSDDTVPPGAYASMVRTLCRSGSDLVVGAIVRDEDGVRRTRPWVRRVHARRRLAVRVEDVPEVLTNVMACTKVFRRDFLDRIALRFPEGVSYEDQVPVTRAYLLARSFDVVPEVVYHWRIRDDGTSITQRKAEVADLRDRVAALREVAGLLGHADEQVRRRWFARVFRQDFYTYLRPATEADDDYWSLLREGVEWFATRAPAGFDDDLELRVRLAVRLLREDRREDLRRWVRHPAFATSDLPVVRDGRHLVAVPPDELADPADPTLRIRAVDLACRPRLESLDWSVPGRLGVRCVAALPFADPSRVEVVTRLALRGPLGVTPVPDVVAVPDEHDPDPGVANRVARRANEDHTRSLVRGEVDLEALVAASGARAVTRWVLHVRAAVLGEHVEATVVTRSAHGSVRPGRSVLLAGALVRATWSERLGLVVEVRRGRATVTGTAPPADDLPGVAADRPVLVVDDVAVDEAGSLLLTGRAAGVAAGEVFLRGRQARTAAAPLDLDDGRFRVRVPTTCPGWERTPATLPANVYTPVAQGRDGRVRVLAGSGLDAPAAGHPGRGWSVEVDDERRLRLRRARHEDPATDTPFAQATLRRTTYRSARSAGRADLALFESFAGVGTGDGPRAVSDLLAARGTKLDLVWSVADPSVQPPPGTRTVLRGSREWYEAAGSARLLVSSGPLPDCFEKAAGQTYVQTWHGTPLKRLGLDAHSRRRSTRHHRQRVERELAAWDVLVSQSAYCTGVLRSGLGFEGRILEVGRPSNDLLVGPHVDRERDRARAVLGVDPEQTVVLYAPTWREDARAGSGWAKVVGLDHRLLTEARPDVVVLVRGHPLTASRPRVTGARVLDVTGHPDIARLYLAADVLVTDYSAAMVDFAVTDKPTVLLAPDLEVYRDRVRGLYVDLAAVAPGPVVATTEQVLDHLDGRDWAAARKRVRTELAPHDDGSVTERLLDAVSPLL